MQNPTHAVLPDDIPSSVRLPSCPAWCIGDHRPSEENYESHFAQGMDFPTWQPTGGHDVAVYAGVFRDEAGAVTSGVTLSVDEANTLDDIPASRAREIAAALNEAADQVDAVASGRAV